MITLPLEWLGEPAKHRGGQVLGIPFNQGEVADLPHVRCGNRQVQTWPMAYWPDGSIKWMGTALSGIYAKTAPQLIIEQMETNSKSHVPMIEETSSSIILNTGKLRVVLNKVGKDIVDSIFMGQQLLATRGRVIGCVETYDTFHSGRTIHQYNLAGDIQEVTVEQDGPIRAVVKISGSHRIVADDRLVLPFCIRIIGYKDMAQLEIKHTFIYDQPTQSGCYIKGIGMAFDMPLQGACYNRQVKFAGDTGMFAENSQFMSTRIDHYKHLYMRQLEGECFLNEDACDHVQDMAIWNQYKLRQSSGRYYEIVKRTGKGCAFIHADHGERSLGSLYVADEAKGMLVGVKDFREKGPMMLEVNNLAQEEGEVKLWFWSPDERAMDLRHYDTVTHVQSSYEGAKKLDATPVGVANTHELFLEGFERRTEDVTLFELAQEIQNPPRLRCELQRYHDTKALGIYSMKEMAGAKRIYIEEQLQRILEFYLQEVEQRQWYGCWDYGDVMHTYDQVRHKWRYDMGGYAWQNTELAPNIWLWFSYLRSGDPRIFTLAEAMTRHTSEVDIYHIGPYKGLGSRHNVSHWGCGAKEPRIAMAGLHRFYYYLTGDERVGDIMEEVVDADYATLNKDPMGEYYGDDSFETHARSGPDWVAYVSNWYTHYERTLDTNYLNKILRGIESLYEMPHRLLSGSCFGYTPKDGRLHYMGEDTYGYHLAICMGGPQVWMEIADLLPDERLKAMIIEFGEFYFLSHEEKMAKTSAEISAHWDWPMFATGISAYAAKQTDNQALARKTREVLLGEKDRCITLPVEVKSIHTPYMVDSRQEIEGITTNTMSQWSLNAIVCMELIELDECNDTQEH